MIKVVQLDIWKNTVILMAGTTVREFDLFYYDNVTRMTNGEYKGIRKDIEDEHLCNGVTWILDNGTVVVFVRYADAVGSVAHEIFHAANKVLCRAGVNHDADAEPWAYLIGYLTEKYYEMLEDNSQEEKK